MPDSLPVFGDCHRSELVDGDLLAVEPVALLLEDDGAGRCELDGERDEAHHGQREQQHQRCKQDVAGSLQHAAPAVERCLGQRHDRQPVERIGACLDQVEDENVRDVVQRRRRIAKLAHHTLRAFREAQWQRDENRTDPIWSHVLRQLRKRAEQIAVDSLAALVSEAHFRSIVEEPVQLESELGPLANAVGEAATQRLTPAITAERAFPDFTMAWRYHACSKPSTAINAGGVNRNHAKSARRE